MPKQRTQKEPKITEVNDLVDNSEYQRRRLMSRDERARGAVIDTAAELYKQNEKDGKNTSFEDCQRFVEECAEKQDQRNRR